MKNIKFFLLSLSLLCAGFSRLSAQCASVVNDSDCPVDVTIRIYDLTGTSCTLCNTITGVNIAPNGGVYNINCGACSGCDIEVEISSVGGMPTTPASPSASKINPGGTSFSSAAPCTASKIDMNGLQTSFKIQ